MESTPFISFVIPVYNAERFIYRCMDSLSAQSENSEWEAIIIDDGSQDSSLEICRRFADKQPRFRVFSQTNHGSNFTYEKGAGLARGQYIVFLDHDDWIAPHFIETSIQILEEFQPDVVQFCCQYYNPSTLAVSMTESLRNSGFFEGRKGIEQMYHDYLRTIDSPLFLQTHARKIIKKELLTNCHFIGDPCGADEVFISTVISKAHSVYLSSQVLFRVLELTESQSRRFSPLTSAELKMEMYCNLIPILLKRFGRDSYPLFELDYFPECYKRYLLLATEGGSIKKSLLKRIKQAVKHRRRSVEYGLSSRETLSFRFSLRFPRAYVFLRRHIPH